MIIDEEENEDKQRNRKQQREQAREASKAHGYIHNTWNLFCMFLQGATNAMIVWKEFEDSNYIEFPEALIYEPPEPLDFAKAMREVLPDMAEALRKGRNLNPEEEMIRLARGDLGAPRTKPEGEE
jgi:hypothetical protein